MSDIKLDPMVDYRMRLDRNILIEECAQTVESYVESVKHKHDFSDITPEMLVERIVGAIRALKNPK